MKTFTKFVTAMVVIGSVSVATAASRPTRIMTIVSNPGVNEIVFLTDVAHKLRAFSDDTGFEACARIATDGTRYGVVVDTAYSHIGCVVEDSDVPPGMHPTAFTIHSHGLDRPFNASRQDKRFMGPAVRRDATISFAGQKTEEFSTIDYEAPGYLAGKYGLYFQHGPGTQTTVVSYK